MINEGDTTTRVIADAEKIEERVINKILEESFLWTFVDSRPVDYEPQTSLGWFPSFPFPVATHERALLFAEAYFGGWPRFREHVGQGA